MPLYSYRCPTCGAETDEFNPISDRESGAPECHGQMTPVISPVRGIVRENCHYVCPQTDQPVTSWAQRRNIFAEHGLMDAREIDMKARIAGIKQRRAQDQADVAAELKAMAPPGVDLTPYMPTPAI